MASRFGALYRLGNSQGRSAPVLISHGTFSNRFTCLPIAEFFARRGHPTYILEWRGRDVGLFTPRRFTYWDLAEEEFPQALDAIAQKHAPPIHLVTHSGGGLAASLMLARNTGAQQATGSLTLLATQSTHLKSLAKLDQIKTATLVHLARLPGFWPRRLLNLGPTNESAFLKVQWHLWNRSGKITCRDGADLFEQLDSCKTPTLAIAGKADRFIAPSEGCRALLNAFGGPREFLHAGRAEGFVEDFTHSRLWKSRAAERDIWPRIADWINNHSAASLF